MLLDIDTIFRSQIFNQMNAREMMVKRWSWLLVLILIRPGMIYPAASSPQVIKECPHPIILHREGSPLFQYVPMMRDIVLYRGWYYVVYLLSGETWRKQYHTSFVMQIHVYTQTWKPVWNSPPYPVNGGVTDTILPKNVPKEVDPRVFPRLFVDLDRPSCPYLLGLNGYLLCIDKDLNAKKALTLPLVVRDYFEVNGHLYAYGDYHGKLVHEIALPEGNVARSFLPLKAVRNQLKIRDPAFNASSVLIGLSRDGTRGYLFTLRPLATLVFDWETGAIQAVHRIDPDSIPHEVRNFHNLYWSFFEPGPAHRRAWLTLHDYMTFGEFQQAYPVQARKMAERWLHQKGRIPDAHQVIRFPKALDLALEIDKDGRLNHWVILKKVQTPEKYIGFGPPFPHLRMPALPPRFGRLVMIHKGEHIRIERGLCRF